jgi:polyisoprenyl-phosphate glycosyltransferase
LNPTTAAQAPRVLQRLSVVLPAYNEAANLPQVLEGLCAALPQWAPQWELIVVDDGSRDATPLVMAPWCQRPGLRYLRLSRNFGKEAALTAGLDHAEGQVVLLMDADGQHPLALVPPMLAAWAQGHDMVCALRQSRADESWPKRLGTRLFFRIANAGSPFKIPNGAGDFRVMDRKVVQALRALPERNRFMKGLYAWVGFDAHFLPYTPAPRISGKAQFSFGRLLQLAFTGITAFSTLPLRLWSGAGALIALLALCYGLYIVVEHFVSGHDVPGWATVATGLMFFSGVQLLSVGVLGEYIGRIFEEVKRRPLYLISHDSQATPSPPP